MAYRFRIGFADTVFRITCVHDTTAFYCSKFITDAPFEHDISITQAHIEAERQKCLDEDKGIDPSLQNASDNVLETVALLRALADYIPAHNRILMHGSAIAVNGNGYIFTAVSGTGKSTHTGLLRKLHGENAKMINDDKPFLLVKEDGVYVCGTPWMGKHALGENIVVPLKGIFFLRRSEENVLQQIEPNHAVSPLIAQCHRPVDPLMMMNTLDLLDQILKQVKVYDFGCNMDISAAELSSSVME